jgi:hypothetical protein
MEVTARVCYTPSRDLDTLRMGKLNRRKFFIQLDVKEREGNKKQKIKINCSAKVCTSQAQIAGGASHVNMGECHVGSKLVKKFFFWGFEIFFFYLKEWFDSDCKCIGFIS